MPPGQSVTYVPSRQLKSGSCGTGVLAVPPSPLSHWPLRGGTHKPGHCSVPIQVPAEQRHMHLHLYNTHLNIYQLCISVAIWLYVCLMYEAD